MTMGTADQLGHLRSVRPSLTNERAALRAESCSNPDSPVRNELLAALSADARERLGRYLERTPLRRRQILHERNVPITYAYFIEEGAASLLSRSGGSRESVEVGNLGRKDFIGLPILLGTGRSPHRCVVQAPGEALRIKACDLQRALQDLPDLQQILFGYVQVAMVQSAQLALCNAKHSLRQRLARWLLESHDLCGGQAINVTHQCLSRAIGVRRAGITTALGDLEGLGIVARGRGEVIILNRSALENESCECYRAIRAEHQRVLPCEHRRAEGRSVQATRELIGLSARTGDTAQERAGKAGTVQPFDGVPVLAQRSSLLSAA